MINSVTSNTPITAVWGNSVATELNAVKRVVCTAGTRPTGANGIEIYETDTKRTLVHDGTGWVIMNEPWQNGSTVMTAGIGTLSSLDIQTMKFKRSDGAVDFRARYRIVFNGTGSTFLQATLPLPVEAGAVTDSAIVGWGREGTVTSAMVIAQAGGSGMQIITYNNAYPGGNNADLRITGRYQMASRYS